MALGSTFRGNMSTVCKAVLDRPKAATATLVSLEAHRDPWASWGVECVRYEQAMYLRKQIDLGGFS
jgi:hypothetical protein